MMGMKIAILCLLVTLCHAKPEHLDKHAEEKRHEFMKRQFIEPVQMPNMVGPMGPPIGRPHGPPPHGPPGSGMGDSGDMDSSGSGIHPGLIGPPGPMLPHPHLPPPPFMPPQPRPTYQNNQTLCEPEHSPCGPYSPCAQVGPNAVFCGFNSFACNLLNCSNGAICIMGSCGNPRCQCPPEWTGMRCDEIFDPCKHRDCGNGQCIAEDPPAPPPPPPGFPGPVPMYRHPYQMRKIARCECPEGYTGYRCESYMAPPLEEDLTLAIGDTVTIVYPTEEMDEERYTNNARARWTLTSDDDNVEFDIVVNRFDTEGCCDRLNILPGSVDPTRPNPQQQMYRPMHPYMRPADMFSGCMNPGQHLTSIVDSTVHISFTTDMSVVRTGFNISVTARDASENPCSDSPCTGGSTCVEDDDDEGNHHCEPRAYNAVRYSCDEHAGPMPPPPGGPMPMPMPMPVPYGTGVMVDPPMPVDAMDDDAMVDDGSG